MTNELNGSRHRTCVPAAHRGNRSAGPDNSLQALSSAITEGIPFIEVDVRKDLSNTLFLFHDKRIRSGSVEAPLALMEREVGSLTKEERESLRLSNGEGLPLLSQVLNLVRGSAVTLLLDLKPDSLEMRHLVIEEIVKGASVAGSVVVQCQSQECIQFFSRHPSGIRFLARVHREEDLLPSADSDPLVLQVDPPLLSKARHLRDDNGPVFLLVKSLGEPPDEVSSWQALCQAGADIILTDLPISFMAEIGRPEGL